MARNFSASLAAVVVLAVAPLALRAQQDSTQSDPPASAQANIEFQVTGGTQWQATLETPSDASDPGVSSQWETSMPSQPDITVINVKAPPKTETKADKAKAVQQAKKKLLPPATKAKSAPVATPTPGTKEASPTQTQSQPQNWETEFLVDHMPDHQPDRATPNAEP